MKLVSSIIALTVAVVSVNAQNTDDVIARANAACGLFSNKVYCYGGVIGNFTDEDSFDSNMYLLDLSKNASMFELSKNWRLFNPNTNGVTLAKRKKSQFVTISDTELLLNGGFDASNDRLSDQTIVYNSKTNAWSKHASYVDGQYGVRQIYFGSATLVPNQGVVFYGGYEQRPNTSLTFNTNQNISATLFNHNASRVLGFVSATYLALGNSGYVWSVPEQKNTPSVFTAFQSSVYSPSDKRIYYFGGIYQDTTIPNYVPVVFANWHPFSYAIYYDTVTNTWGNQSLGGAFIPTSRRYHTTTLLPNNPRKVLLYGGEDQGKVSSDICYVLDLDTFTWKPQLFPVTEDGADLLRSRHNALVLDDVLFIIFGLNGSNEPTGVPIALNIASPDNVSYMPVFPGASNGKSSGDSSGKKKLGNAALGGISAAAAVIAIVLIVAVILFIRKRKAKKEQKQREEREKYAHSMKKKFTASTNPSQEQLEVNWDEIEKQYVEVPVPPTPTNITPLAETNAVRSSGPIQKPHHAPRESFDDDTTHINTVSEHSYKNEVRTSNEVQRPAVIDEVVGQHSTAKPDGSN